MSVNEVERFIRDRHRSPDAVRFQQVLAGSLEAYDLEPAEREAILARDYGSLYRRGVHPMAVLFLSQDNREPMASYLAAIGAADERVGQLGALFSNAMTTDEPAPVSKRRRQSLSRTRCGLPYRRLVDGTIRRRRHRCGRFMKGLGGAP